MISSAENARPENRDVLAHLILACADDKLILGHRNSDWTGVGPILEEDIAFSSLAQDNVAHAQALYELAGKLLGKTADQLAFGRGPKEYLCAQIVELPDEFDYATAIARQFFCAHFDKLRFARLAQSSHEPLAKLAKRIAAEQQVQVEHVNGWIERLGNGTDESNQRVQKALDALAWVAPALFEPIEDQEELEASGLYPLGDRDMFEEWESALREVVGRGKLHLTIHRPDATAIGGRRGNHTKHLKELLDEMCEVYRLEPNASW